MVTSAHQKLINNILSLPSAPILLEQVTDKLNEERKKREHFYNEITDAEKVEFINGKIIVHSPVKKEHNDAAGFLYRLISIFVSKHKLGYVGYEKIMITLTRNDYEPDLCFFKKEKSKHFKEGQSLFPAPDLIVEVLSKGTFRNDRGVKFEDYQAHEVEEYWMIDPIKKIVEQYRLDETKNYELILKSKNGIIECQPIKGFKIPVEAIFDEGKNLKELGKILKGG